MAGVLRLLLGMALLPLCWGVVAAFLAAIKISAGAEGLLNAEALSLFGGIAAFMLAWAALAHPVRAYVLGHELTHALWGLMFGALPSDVRVTATGGSVRLSKSNFLIALAPYFFPFYTFLVIVSALVMSAFFRPLPCLPLWMFLVGFTWAFHVLFTLETLRQRQPDVRLYGRIFSWTFIFLANMLVVLTWLASTTPLTFSELCQLLFRHGCAAYADVAAMVAAGVRWLRNSVFSSVSADLSPLWN